MEEPVLQAAFEKAMILHALLTRVHPENSTQIQQKIDALTDPKEKDRFELLRDFLLTFDASTRVTKQSRKWENQTHILNRTASEFVKELGEAPATPIRLMDYLIDHIGDDLRLHFNNKASDAEDSYESIFYRVSKRHAGKGVRPPEDAHRRHNLTYGDLSEVEMWLKNGESRDFVKAFPDKFLNYAANFQIAALERLLKEVVANKFVPEEYITGLLYKTYKSLSEIDRTRHEKAHFVPSVFLKDLPAEETFRSGNHFQLAKAIDWPLTSIIGIDSVFSDESLDAKFDRETYKKIRNVLSHEFENVLELNRSAALLTLIFPKYEDFTTYVLKKSVFNEKTQKLDLQNLIDISKFSFEDVDYESWGSALIERGPVINFYIKHAHLLDAVPKNHKNALLISELDMQLYKKITSLVDSCSEEDVVRYAELKAARMVRDVRLFNEECRIATLGKTLPHKPISLPDIEIAGERFGKPGYTFKLLPYDSPYFPIVGLFTDSCEWAGGHYRETLLHAYIHRTIGIYCIFDPNGEPIAHTGLQRQQEDWSLLILGFEGQSSVNKALLEKVVAEMRSDHKAETFTVGPSSLKIGYQEMRTPTPDELRPDHTVKIDPEKIFDAGRTVENAGIAPIGLIHANPSDDDSEKLKEARRRRLPPSPKP